MRVLKELSFESFEAFYPYMKILLLSREGQKGEGWIEEDLRAIIEFF